MLQEILDFVNKKNSPKTSKKLAVNFMPNVNLQVWKSKDEYGTIFINTQISIDRNIIYCNTMPEAELENIDEV